MCNYLFLKASDTVLPIDKRLAQYIKDKVSEEGIYSARQLKLLLAEVLKSRDDFIKNKALPACQVEHSVLANIRPD